MCALLFVGAFAAGMIVWLIAIGWFTEEALASVPFGVRHVELSTKHAAIALVFFAASHLAPHLVPRRRLAPRVVLHLGEDGTYRAPPTATLLTLNAAELRAASRARHDGGLAWSVAFSLAICGTSFFVPATGFHSPRHHPLEQWVFFAASVVALASHVRLPSRRQRRETSLR